MYETQRPHTLDPSTLDTLSLGLKGGSMSSTPAPLKSQDGGARPSALF